MSKLGTKIFEAKKALADEMQAHAETRHALAIARHESEMLQDESIRSQKTVADLNVGATELALDNVQHLTSRGINLSTIPLLFALGAGSLIHHNGSITFTPVNEAEPDNNIEAPATVKPVDLPEGFVPIPNGQIDNQVDNENSLSSVPAVEEGKIPLFDKFLVAALGIVSVAGFVNTFRNSSSVGGLLKQDYDEALKAQLKAQIGVDEIEAHKINEHRDVFKQVQIMFPDLHL